MNTVMVPLAIFWIGWLVLSVIGSVFNRVKWSTTVMVAAGGVLFIAEVIWLTGR
ncbi:hypothetical protein [Paracoccus shandongensis]|uniref:hypothetical protein n=1 Tax=Paracoccus shandongensis TaxID=2816048 RepID=UPI001A8D3BAE|nr:hypothetical protein [Paracoccus shandongensis]